MSEQEFKRNELLAQAVIKGLKKRKITGYYAATKEDALKQALALIDENSTITMGGCMSAYEIGLIDALKTGPYTYLDREEAEDKHAIMHMAYGVDTFLTSANAITDDGIIVNIDGNANRVSAIAYGPKQVIFIVGMNKVCPDLDSALKRARNTAAPINAQRFDVNTPCKKTGKCLDCTTADTICCQFLITRASQDPDRIKVILVNDHLGF